MEAQEEEDKEDGWKETKKREKKIHHWSGCKSLFEALVLLPPTARKDADWFQTHNHASAEKAYMGDKLDGQLKLSALQESIHLSIIIYP